MRLLMLFDFQKFLSSSGFTLSSYYILVSNVLWCHYTSKICKMGCVLISFPFNRILGEIFVLKYITSGWFFMLMFRPISLALLCKLDVFLNCICVSRWDSKAMSPHNKFSTLLKIIHLLPIVHYILCKMLLLDRLTWMVYQSTLGFFHKLYEYFLIV